MLMKKHYGLVQQLKASYVRIGKPANVMLGFSGGSDSTALLHSLVMLREEEGFGLSCAHVNHGIRISSDAEEQWVTRLLDRMGITLLKNHVEMPWGGNLEARARALRYQAFREAMKETGSEVTALAHHAGDQAETMIMRLMHGTGSVGLAGMAELNGPFWRPFLPVPKSELISFLKGLNAEWIEDESNDDTKFMRNFVRLKIFPLMEAATPGISERMSQTAILLHDENLAWEHLENDWLKKHAKLTPPFVFLLIEPFLRENAAVQRRLLRRITRESDIEIDFKQTESLREAALSSSYPLTINLPKGGKAFRSEIRLHIITHAVQSSHVYWPQPRQLEPSGNLGDGRKEQTFDGNLLKGAVIRQARQDDRIVPLGMHGSQPLLKYLSARKVDQPFRCFWPVLASGSTILWVPGHGPAQTAAVTSSSETRIKLAFEAILPDE